MRLQHLVAAAAFFVPCLAVHADTLNYSYTGLQASGCPTPSTCPSLSLDFQLPSTSTPTPGPSGYVMPVLAVTRNTTGIDLTAATVEWIPGRPVIFRIFENPSNSLYFYPGSFNPLFSVSPSSITLLTGIFPNATLASNSNTWTGTLAITDIGSTSPVPEPSSLALLGTGLLGLVAAARQRLA